MKLCVNAVAFSFFFPFFLLSYHPQAAQEPPQKTMVQESLPTADKMPYQVPAK